MNPDEKNLDARQLRKVARQGTKRRREDEAKQTRKYTRANAADVSDEKLYQAAVDKVTETIREAVVARIGTFVAQTEKDRRPEAATIMVRIPVRLSRRGPEQDTVVNIRDIMARIEHRVGGRENLLFILKQHGWANTIKQALKGVADLPRLAKSALASIVVNVRSRTWQNTKRELVQFAQSYRKRQREQALLDTATTPRQKRLAQTRLESSPLQLPGNATVLTAVAVGALAGGVTYAYNSRQRRLTSDYKAQLQEIAEQSAAQNIRDLQNRTRQESDQLPEFTLGGSASQDCVVMQPQDGYLDYDAKTMWTGLPPGYTPSTNQRKALEEFTNRLRATQWAANTVNSPQAFWLYRWMGPLCSQWTDRAYRDRFNTRKCQQRFDLLNSLMQSALLFLFLGRKSAVQIFETGNAPTFVGPDTINCLQRQLAEGPDGYGILILDDCQPGHLRIIGTGVNQLYNAHEFQEPYWADAIDKAQELGLTLLGNSCWKYLNSTAAQPTMFWPARNFPDRSGNQHQTYTKAKTKALAVKAEAVAQGLTKYPTYLDVPDEKTNTSNDFVQRLVTYFQQVNLQDHTTNTINTTTNASVETKFNGTGLDRAWQNANRFTQTLTDTEFENFQQNSINLLNKPGLTQFVQNQVQATCGQGRVKQLEIIHTLIIDPVIVVAVTEPCDWHVWVGDAWVVEPVITQLKRQGAPYAAVPYTPLQRLITETFQDKNREFFQDILYTKFWSTFFIGVG